MAKVTQDAVMIITDKPTIKDAVGYHDKVESSGMPFGYVFQDVSAELEEPWSVTFSHEILELVLNRHANYYAIGPHPKDRKRNVVHWLEACDACQDYSYKIGKIAVSDFVLPLYFTPENEASGKNDYLETPGLKSFGIAKGGYIGFFDPKTGEETTVLADKRAQERQEIKEMMGRFRRKNRKQFFEHQNETVRTNYANSKSR